MIAAIWIFAGVGLVLWSLLAWAAFAMLTLAPGWADALSGWLAALPLRGLLDPWLPGWQTLAQALAHLVQALAALVSASLGGLAPWLVGGVWAAGVLLMLGFAAILHAIVRAANRPAPLVAH